MATGKRSTKQVDPFYTTKAWWKLRSKRKAEWRRAGLPCAWCGQPIDWSKPTVADHKHNRKQYPELALEPDNIEILHHACNTRKYHASERQIEPREDIPTIGVDGYPISAEGKHD